MAFLALVGAVAVLAGMTASIAAAGVGSMLVPLLALRVDFKLAVALVAVPHLVATALRLWPIRRDIDWKVMRGFGVACAVTGLIGAFVHGFVSSEILTRTFAVLLMLAGLLGVTGWAEKVRIGRRTAWLTGGIVGFTGGLVGEQGGIRSVGLMAFDLRRDAFVATGTAVALVLDGVRAPVYMASHASELGRAWPFLVVATAGAAAGTWIGHRLLRRIPEAAFKRVVFGVVLVIGLLLLVRPLE